VAKEKLMRLTVQIPDTLYKASKILAVKRGTTLRALVIRGLEAQLKGGAR